MFTTTRAMYYSIERHVLATGHTHSTRAMDYSIERHVLATGHTCHTDLALSRFTLDFPRSIERFCIDVLARRVYP